MALSRLGVWFLAGTVVFATLGWATEGATWAVSDQSETSGGLLDVTDTTAGRTAIAETAGSDAIDASDYQAVQNVPGDPGAIWVLPQDAAIPDVTIADDGKVTVDAVDAPRGLAIGGEDKAAHASKVHWLTPRCYARYTAHQGDLALGWFDHCTQWAAVDYDHDGSRDHYVFYQYGTCKSSAMEALTDCKLADRAGASSPTLHWEDWAPKADKAGGNCTSVDLSLEVQGLGIADDYEACDTMDINKYAAAGRFSNEWKGHALQSERSVQYRVSFGVANGKTPSLSVSWSLDGTPVIG